MEGFDRAQEPDQGIDAGRAELARDLGLCLFPIGKGAFVRCLAGTRECDLPRASVAARRDPNQALCDQGVEVARERSTVEQQEPGELADAHLTLTEQRAQERELG